MLIHLMMTMVYNWSSILDEVKMGELLNAWNVKLKDFLAKIRVQKRDDKSALSYVNALLDVRATKI